MIIEINNLKIESDTYTGAYALLYAATWEELCVVDSKKAWWLTNVIGMPSVWLPKLMADDTMNDKAKILDLLNRAAKAKGGYSILMKKWYQKTEHYPDKYWTDPDFFGDESPEQIEKDILDYENEHKSLIELCLLIKSQPKVIELMNEF